MSHLFIVRHGEAEGNAERRLLGWMDVPLSERGRVEAKALGHRLAASNVRAVVSSDLARAAETARAIAEVHGLEVVIDPRLREIANGDWTGLLPEEAAGGWPDLWELLLSGEDFRRPGGEDWAGVRERAVEAVTGLPDLAEDEAAVVVTHSGTALSLLAWAAGVPPGRDAYAGPFAPLRTASISVITMPGAWILTVNDIGHLPEPDQTPVRTWIRRSGPGAR